MKKTYLTPAVNVEEVNVEKGFAVSGADAFGIQDFGYADGTEDGSADENSAW